MKRRVGGNWKMHLDLAGAVRLAADMRRLLGSFHGVEMVVFPPFPFLDAVGRQLRGSAIALGAQDLHVAKKGAYTGAVSAQMLRSVGCVEVLVGHSERRSVFGDTDDCVAEKLRVALGEGLRPTLCIGETLEEREGGATLEVLLRQLESALPASLEGLVLAYEPVWAIGTGRAASPEQAGQVHAWLRAQLPGVPLTYGGSVKAANARDIAAEACVDGALVGGASLKATEFASIVRSFSR